MPPDAREILCTRFDVSRETMERLDAYEAILSEWAPTLSLVGRATLDDAWNRHFLDSAQLFRMIGDASILDMGTGAGFPGMVLAIMGSANVHLSENNQQKIRFLETVAERTGTAVTIHNSKVEALYVLKVGIVTARAVAPLTKLLAMAAHQFATGSDAIFLKGRNALQEIEDARKAWNFDLETAPSLTSEESSILRLTRIRPKE